MVQGETDLLNLTISPATEEQRLEMLKLIFGEWGTTEVGTESFTRYLSDTDAKSHMKDETLTFWVLVPEDALDTLDILSCCRTHRREVSILHAGSDKPISSFGYAIGVVVTPKKYRGRGYARRMLTLLHYALAPNVYSSPGVNIRIPASVYPGAFSVLYSDVGSYYKRCGPEPGEPGWEIQNPISTFWQLSEALALLSGSLNSTHNIRLLSEEEVASLLSSDVPDWDGLPRAANATYVAFSPSALPNSRWITRSTIHPTHKPSNTFWGAQTPQGDFITWAFDYHTKPRSVVITRVKADSNTFPALLLEALRAGENQDCELAEVWNLSDELKEVAAQFGAITRERTTHLPSIRWYGSEPAKNIAWIRNEYYSYTAT